MKPVASGLKVAFYNILVLALLMEGVGFAASVTGWRGVNHYTTYYLALINRFRAEPLLRRGQWYTEFEDWGTWHRPNAVTRDVSTCFSAIYRANAYGARDDDRPQQSGVGRTVVLGDSFIEGWGVQAAERLTNQLETKLERPMLNFGAAYHVGPLQYEILYQQLASEFDHDQVIVALLPANDFTDNDPRYWRQERQRAFQSRYRPYYGEDGARRYKVDKPKDSHPIEGSEIAAQSLDQFLYNNTWSYSLLRRLGALQRRDHDITRAYSGYVDPEPRQIRPVLASLQRIQTLARANGATVTLVLIPAVDDFMRQESGEALTIQPVFRRFAAQQGLPLIDLIEEMPKVDPDYRRYYHRCDRHWSAYGNQVAAAAIAKVLATGATAELHTAKEVMKPE